MLLHLVDHFRALPAFRALSAQLPARTMRAGVGGLHGSSGALLVAALAHDHPQRVIAVVASSPSDAEAWLSDLVALRGEGAVLYPQREALGEEEPHLEIAGERVETIDALASGTVRIVVTTLRATTELSRMSAATGHRLDVSLAEPLAWEAVVTRLERMGYERCPSVRDVAQFAVRGGIVDVYGFGMAEPVRFEWWGDELISLRSFDLDSQRSHREIDAVTILPVAPLDEQLEREDSLETSRRSLLELLPADTLVVVDRGVNESDVQRIWDEASHSLEIARRLGEDVSSRDAVFLDPASWHTRWAGLAKLEVEREPIDHPFRLGGPPGVERKMKRLAALVRDEPTLILCDNEGQLERLEEILGGDDARYRRLPATLTLALGSLTAGFRMPGLVVLTDHEIFQRQRRLRRPRRYRQALGAAVAAGLTPGDYVVHLEHGIGLYRGIETIELGGAIEVAVLEYEGGDRLNVPLYRLDQIEPFRTTDGSDALPPRLHRLGGKRWARQRAKTEAAVNRMAAELLDLYAQRRVARGFQFPPDTQWQRELESSFLYEDTPDQRKAADETKRNMERPQPMDRLIVGDVGYGKTEVAVRAAFKAVQAGKQTAVLVPTTILAEQHGRTFDERLADFPVKTEVLSRFRTPAEQRRVLQEVAAGSVDIVIGTHRLLSSDVRFRDLGLLVVDEEHRFGVRHKERLKALRLEVDVLTLTATPIPRTLQGALAGLRDLTIIQTPPRDRSPVLTFIEPWDDDLLAEAMARELDRGGQVFFVHNRIETIEAVADRVRRLAPRATVAVAHGKQRERDLDQHMRQFVAGEVDILVSTMIVESGLDVPNANTMIVHRAHEFGLAQLYQLRGRVGRGHRRAYCYLLVPDLVDPDAERRLKVLEHHTELGAGYWIALRDLEIRGAGNLLGAAQSGHAHAVGFDLYLRWLDDAVRVIQGEAGTTDQPSPDVTFDTPARIPDEYVADDDAKLDLYRRLARAVQLGEIASLRDEMRDRFGPLPDEADRLLIVSELRILGAALGLRSVLVRGDEARLKFRAEARPKLLRLTAALDEIQFAAEVRHAVPLALKLRRLGGLAVGPGLVRALGAAIGTNDEKVGY